MLNVQHETNNNILNFIAISAILMMLLDYIIANDLSTSGYVISTLLIAVLSFPAIKYIKFLKSFKQTNLFGLFSLTILISFMTGVFWSYGVLSFSTFPMIVICSTILCMYLPNKWFIIAPKLKNTAQEAPTPRPNYTYTQPKIKPRTEEPKAVVKIKPNEMQKIIDGIFDAEIKNGDEFGIKDLDRMLFEIELDAEEVLEITELKRRATLYEWMNAGKFPRQKKLYSNHVGWNVLEVWEWASNRPGNREKFRLVQVLKRL